MATAKDIKLAKYRAHGASIQAAAKQAGFKNRQYGWRRLQLPDVQKIYKKEIERMEKKLELTFDYKINKLQKIIDMCGEDAATAKTAVSAIAEANKMQGHLAAKKLELTTSEEYRQSLESAIKDATSYNN